LNRRARAAAEEPAEPPLRTALSSRLGRWGPFAPGWRANSVAAAALAVALVFTGWICWREIAAQQIELIADDLASETFDASAPADLDRWIAICGPHCDSRGLEAASAAKAVLAAKAAGTAQQRLYDSAERLTRAALRRNPLSAEGWARLAMVLSARSPGPPSSETLAAVKKSFAAAPYSRGTSVWRIGYCGRHWNEIGPELRHAAAAELAWLALIDRSLAHDVVAHVADADARYALSLMLGD
jgi:hypothetical protein